MGQASLIFCQCGTPLLRDKHYRMTAEAWTKAYESGDPNAKIKLTPFYLYYRWHYHLLQPSGDYAILDESERVDFCPACKRPLEEEP